MSNVQLTMNNEQLAMSNGTSAKKKVLVLLLAVLFLFLSAPLYSLYGVIDDAGLLSGEETAEINAMIEELAAVYNFELIIYTVNSINGEDPIDYSWAYLDGKSLYGDSWDGCLLLQSTEYRDYAFTASGRGEKILNNTAYNKLEKDVVSFLRQDDYAGAYKVFASDWEKFLVLEAQGRNYNFLCETGMHSAFIIAASILSFIFGLIKVHAMKSVMNTALPKTEANAYITPGSLAFTQSQDTFLYSRVTKTVRSSSSGEGAEAADPAEAEAAGAGDIRREV